MPCERIGLRHDWPGWWSKQNLFDPSIEGDLLYFDLDSLIVGELSDISAVSKPTILRDVYRPNGLQSSVMRIPQAIKAPIWKVWTSGPEHWMQVFKRGGDQAFLEQWSPMEWQRWQDVLTGQLVSYKTDVRPRNVVPANTRVIFFHGSPRPWQTSLWTI